MAASKKRRLVNCPHCDAELDVGKMTMSTVCQSCMKTARIEDLKVDTYWAGAEFYTAGAVKVAKRAVLVAKVRANKIEVHGEVKGPVQLREGMRIGKKGRVFGDITAHSLRVDEGAILVGRIEIVPLEAPAAPVEVEVEKPPFRKKIKASKKKKKSSSGGKKKKKKTPSM